MSATRFNSLGNVSFWSQDNITCALLLLNAWHHGFVADPPVSVGESRCSGGETLTLRFDYHPSLCFEVTDANQSPHSVSYRKKIHGFHELWRAKKASDIVFVSLVMVVSVPTGLLRAHYQSKSKSCQTNFFGGAFMINQLIGPKYPIDMFGTWAIWCEPPWRASSSDDLFVMRARQACQEGAPKPYFLAETQNPLGVF